MMIEQFLNDIENNNIEIDDKSIDIENKKIFLYGAGNIGRKMCGILRESNVKLLGFIDRNSQLPRRILNLNVYDPEIDELNEHKEEVYIILSGLFHLKQCEEIKIYLNVLGFKNVYALHEVNLAKFGCDEFYNSLSKKEENKFDIKTEKDKIIKAYNLLEKEEDKKLYIDYIKAHITMNFTKFPDPLPMDLQYLAHDIDHNANYDFFIDCGAYDGDTIRNLTDKDVKLKNIVAFEPQNELFDKLQKTINENKCIETAIAVPCGVYSEAQTYKFKKNQDALSASSIDNNGDDMIQCVSIDQMLKGFEPTFIKMDIEGAEVSALKGAKETIKKYRPQLAICVYHSLADIWNIPLLIHSIDPSYKFYLRNYNYMGLETVLYAF